MTNKQRFVFTLSMSFGMATIMSFLGNVLAKGWNAVTLTSWFIWWLPTVTIAFTYSWFVAAKITQKQRGYPHFNGFAVSGGGIAELLT